LLDCDIFTAEENPKMNRTCTLTATVLSVMTLALVFSANAKPAPERHAAYLHALADLRHARAYLAHPDSGEMHDAEKNAIDEIDKAIAEIKAAAIDDGKNIDDHPGLDSHLRWVGRLNKAAALLDKAHDDAAKEEDDASAQGLQARVLGHIGKAHKHVEEAISLEQ
jgi:tetratricopeptide (TPR) repeat protein